jgi:hypothetical protein
MTYKIPRQKAKYETKSGWWKLKITGVDELEDGDKYHIAEAIKEGYTEGEIVQEKRVE